MGKCFGPVGINADMVEDGQGLRGFPFRDIGQHFLGKIQCAVVAREHSRGAADASGSAIVFEMGVGLLVAAQDRRCDGHRSEEHTSELQSLMRSSYAVFCLKKKKQK